MWTPHNPNLQLNSANAIYPGQVGKLLLMATTLFKAPPSGCVTTRSGLQHFYLLLLLDMEWKNTETLRDRLLHQDPFKDFQRNLRLNHSNLVSYREVDICLCKRLSLAITFFHFQPPKWHQRPTPDQSRRECGVSGCSCCKSKEGSHSHSHDSMESPLGGCS